MFLIGLDYYSRVLEWSAVVLLSPNPTRSGRGSLFSASRKESCPSKYGCCRTGRSHPRQHASWKSTIESTPTGSTMPLVLSSASWSMHPIATNPFLMHCLPTISAKWWKLREWNSLRDDSRYFPSTKPSHAPIKHIKSTIQHLLSYFANNLSVITLHPPSNPSLEYSHLFFICADGIAQAKLLWANIKIITWVRTSRCSRFPIRNNPSALRSSIATCPPTSISTMSMNPNTSKAYLSILKKWPDSGRSSLSANKWNPTVSSARPIIQKSHFTSKGHS